MLRGIYPVLFWNILGCNEIGIESRGGRRSGDAETSHSVTVGLSKESKLGMDVGSGSLSQGGGGLQVILAAELQIHECLGCGASGAVYRASWQGSEVAVKQLSLFCLDRQHVASFYQEATILAELSHPNVVRFYGVCTDLVSRSTLQPQPCMVTEHMPAGSLSRLLSLAAPAQDSSNQQFKGGEGAGGGGGRRAGGLSPAAKLQLGLDVARGMMYIHTRGIVHSDLKSDNCLVSRSPSGKLVCKVADLGLARHKRRTFLSGAVRWSSRYTPLDGSRNCENS